MARSPLARIGTLLADDSRAEIVSVLLDGRAYTGSELARHTGIAPSTASEHLSKLLDGGLVTVTAQGRHRYWSIASAEIATMLEGLHATSLGEIDRPRAPRHLLFVRTCYDHLAGHLAVAIFDGLVADGRLGFDGDDVRLTDAGASFLGGIGVDVDSAVQAKRPTARHCIDWTERRPHLAGALGAGLLDAMRDNRWIASQSTPRSVRLTRSGRAALLEHFGIEAA